MRTLIFLIISSSLYFSMQVKAQSNNEQTNIESLTQRVDSLEHELSYLKLIYELNSLNSDISMFSNDVQINAANIKLNMNSRNFDYKIGNAYLQLYESYQDKMESLQELIKKKKEFFALKVITYPFTDRELGVLMASYNTIDSAYKQLESSMKLLKLNVDFYRKSM